MHPFHPYRFVRLALLVIVLAGSPPAGAQEAGVAGVWRGSYRCAQGVTALVLRIQGAGDALTARFQFSADPSNPGVPSGDFAMRGRFDPKTRRLELRQERWVEQPAGYVMVDLDGALSADGATVSGRVLHELCTTFSVARSGK